MPSIKLTLTHEGAEALREFAKSIPIAIENIQSATEKLYAVYQSVTENLGAHNQEFESLLDHIKKMQLEATSALNVLIPNMNKTADRIDDYVAFDPASAVTLGDASDVGYISHYIPRSNNIYLNAQSYTAVEIAEVLDIQPDQLSVAYTKDANNTSKQLNEFWTAIRHPTTGEMLKSVKGYYISTGAGDQECVYAEYVDSRGLAYSYAKLKNNGDSVLSQMRKDGIFKSKTKNVSSTNSGSAEVGAGLISRFPKVGGNIVTENFSDNKAESICQALKGVEYIPVTLASAERSEAQIINSISGGDKTDGSCSSLAFAYAGNRAGYDVCDFRGGRSCDVFASKSTIEKIAKLEGVKSVILRGADDTVCAGELLTNIAVGKEYYMAIGGHATIVRINKGSYQYLELQSGIPSENCWKSLTLSAMYDRFCCKDGRDTQSSNYLIDLDSLQSNTEFLNILGYINTMNSKQMRGVDGYER